MDCNWQKTREGTTIVINLPTNNLDFFLNILTDLYSNVSQRCDKCEIVTIKREYTFRSHIFIELCAFLSKKQWDVYEL